MAASIEPPFTFFQEPIKTAFRDAIEAAEMPFGLVPKVLDAVNVVTFGVDVLFAVVDAAMVKFGTHKQRLDCDGRQETTADNEAINSQLCWELMARIWLRYGTP